MNGLTDYYPVCIAIPTYSEKENLRILIPKIQTTLKSRKIDATILIVDDNSPDGTGEFAEELSKIDQNIHIIRRRGKLGLGSAYRDGFKYALNKLNSQAVVQMDADSSHDPKYIPDILAKMREGYDVVVGCRNIPGGAIVGWDLKRKLISNTANRMARLLAGIRIHDATSGYRAYTRQALQKIGLTTTVSNGFSFQIEILFEAQKAESSIAEVPITFIDRRAGRSKLSLKEITSFTTVCLNLALRRLKLRRQKVNPCFKTSH